MQVSTTKKTSVSKSGSLVVSENEGGYADDGIEVGGMTMSELIATLFELELNERGSLCGRRGYNDFGVVRITIERLE